MGSGPELAFIASQTQRQRPALRKTKLHKNEADISLAARSFAEASIVLTCDRKPGPLGDAHRQGGFVVYLNDFPASGLSLRSYIEIEIAKIQATQISDVPSSSSDPNE